MRTLYGAKWLVPRPGIRRGRGRSSGGGFTTWRVYATAADRLRAIAMLRKARNADGSPEFNYFVGWLEAPGWDRAHPDRRGYGLEAANAEWVKGFPYIDLRH